VSFPRYPEYKDSGVEWLGEVPAHWALKPLWTLFRRTKRTGYEDEQLLSVYRDYGVVPKASRDDNNNKPSDDLAPYQLVMPGDLAINKMKAWQGSVAISEHRGIVSPAYFVYESTNSEVPRHLHYLMRSPRYITGYLSLSKGIRVNQWDLEPQYHSRMPIVLPPYAEQSAIATFLDRETAKIDALVAEQEKLIGLLKEKRQAVISHAVTKGLDPTVPMKDSGIEWLGEVPAHWDVKRLKFTLDDIKAGPFGSSLTKDMYVSAGFRVYGQEQVIPNDFSVGDYYIGEEKYKELGQYQISTGDILISCVGTFGKIAVVPPEIEPGIINPRLMRLRCSPAVKPEYLATVLRSTVVFEQFSLLSRGGTMDVINIGTLSDIVLPVPNAGEQEAIFQFVESESNKLDELNAEAQRAIELLKERRSALISAAVTGKIDVRGSAATETARAA
jgi:type I restriction enzyme S subunit